MHTKTSSQFPPLFRPVRNISLLCRSTSVRNKTNSHELALHLACQNHNANLGIIARVGERKLQLLNRLGSESIPAFWPIDNHLRRRKRKRRENPSEEARTTPVQRQKTGTGVRQLLQVPTLAIPSPFSYRISSNSASPTEHDRHSTGAVESIRCKRSYLLVPVLLVMCLAS